MTISVPSLPALVAGRALKADAAAAAERTLRDAARLLDAYELAAGLMDSLPDEARASFAQALARKLAATDSMAKACQSRLDEAVEFCRSFGRFVSPVEMVEVPGAFFEMLSPYLDDAMDPVHRMLAKRAGPGCSVELVESFFPRPVPVGAA
ncbi:hypothetical protein [Rubellimicrobium arenae]|uniref:hypothetical protein n=1 Tax=Rubellimicrobium arenae TaxID=2817372 RepID=UPI001B304BCE|nr:hypothetical protein [Rubellimicrobium arenae]